LQFTGEANDFSTSVTVGNLTTDYSKRVNGANTVYIIKLVNYATSTTSANITLRGLPSSATFPALNDLGVLLSPTSNPDDFNTFAQPLLVSPNYSQVNISSPSFTMNLPAYSLSILRVYVLLSTTAYEMQ